MQHNRGNLVIFQSTQPVYLYKQQLLPIKLRRTRVHFQLRKYKNVELEMENLKAKYQSQNFIFLYHFDDLKSKYFKIENRSNIIENEKCKSKARD